MIEIWQPKDDLAGCRLLHSFGHTNGLLCRNMPNTLCLEIIIENVIASKSAKAICRQSRAFHASTKLLTTDL